MKRITVGLVVMVGFLLASVIYAGAQWCGYGMGVNVETINKFQKETLILRDELMAKELELQNEYGKSVPDTGRIVTLKKEIIDEEAKLQGIADKYNIPTGGGMMMGRGMMGYGMGHGHGMMGPGCGCRGW
ncbi:hypothetical protein [Candidatus Magnetominusculus xianensis]|uniref:Secreted protein n=1 Tax=Candidatus Magnetominusculus xianensis TaxID=1748249 RepID=A0ABR5SB63_9BACT|nr:hypothetical protein [Candidatus Magnetominusculus xianensis]KWT76402.1 hypothetical protein ASN18_3141 [Candidatus Magnetominusculus xianensis]MBF0404870.1 hypothetical protein [Nitrospirota bacterium]